MPLQLLLCLGLEAKKKNIIQLAYSAVHLKTVVRCTWKTTTTGTWWHVYIGRAMLYRLYYFISGITEPIARLYLQQRRRQGKEDIDRTNERLGYPSQLRPEGPLIWCHAPTAAQASAVMPLLQALSHTHQILLTTSTRISGRIMAKRLPPTVIHQYVPVDLPPICNRFLRHWQPDLALWLENTNWPTLLHMTQSHHIPTILLNARLASAKKVSRPRLLRKFTHIYCLTDHDRSQFQKISVDNVETTGSLKYAAPPLPPLPKKTKALKNEIGRRPTWLAALTHPGEETIIQHVLGDLLTAYPDLLTIIVPHDPARGEKIRLNFETNGFTVCQRSRLEPITDETKIFLGDSYGEMGLYYRLAPLAFIGGTLINAGGHNPLEAALLNTSIISGPYMHRFRHPMAELLAAGGLKIVQNGAQLSKELHLQLQDRDLWEQRAAAAYLVALEDQPRIPHVIKHLEALLSATNNSRHL